MDWISNRQNQDLKIASWCPNVDSNALSQAIDLSRHPAIFGHVAIMPDCHMGYGMPIGGVIACDNVVIPNAVGVDIGCGMSASRTSVEAIELTPENIRLLIDEIKRHIPVGEGKCRDVGVSWTGFNSYRPSKHSPDLINKEGFDEKHARNLGTLGGGNHFIELQKDENGYLWVMIHSGSRNLGYVIANHYHNLALSRSKDWKSNIPCDDLAFLPANSQEGASYINDMEFALNYARQNRLNMMDIVLSVLDSGRDWSLRVLNQIDVHHNYASLEKHFGRNLWVHRKGATSARQYQAGIIPGSMGSNSYIVEGLGNVHSFKSCSHGAGRVMGRMEASRVLSVEDCDKSMIGIVFDGWKRAKRKGKNDNYELDLGEAPGAYKDINNVMNNQKDLVKITSTLYPIGVIKG